MSLSSTYGIRIPGFHPGESGSIPDGDAIFRMRSANILYIQLLIETVKKHPVILLGVNRLEQILRFDRR